MSDIKTKLSVTSQRSNYKINQRNFEEALEKLSKTDLKKYNILFNFCLKKANNGEWGVSIPLNKYSKKIIDVFKAAGLTVEIGEEITIFWGMKRI